MFWKKSPTIVRVAGNLTWRFAEIAKGEWVGICVEFPLTTGGDTWKEATEGADEAVQLLMNDLLLNNELEAFLRERGFHLVDSIPREVHPRIRFDVPMEMLKGTATEMALN